ncbi:MAG: HD domain-containing protein, partial [Bdellovibrionales bacterium]
IQRLKDKPSLLLQYQIRLTIDKLAKPLSLEERGKVLHKAIAADCADNYLLGLHRARVLEVLLPDLKKLKGHVQHDHYHRFTADAHLVQTLREVQRAKGQKRSLGVMSKLTLDLTQGEWWALKLTALFHDLAKGRKGDHSTEGAKLVDKYFAEWNYPDALREDVKWLVENHLLMSTAAFRQNPQAQSTWKRLFDRGVTGRRLVLLALFTAIDIRATNPEAWTDWKSQLLLNLVENLRSPQALSLQEHLKYAGQERKTDLQDWLLNVDPVLLQSLSPKVLVEDLKQAAGSKADLAPKVIRVKGRLWVRFHAREDETGKFLGYVKQLFGLGLNIQMSSVSTLKGVGVYDWFCLRTEKTAKQVGQWLALPANKPVKIPEVTFQSIDLMAQDTDEWIFSFRGRDQRGLLLAAAHALVEENLSLKWARAHTWGQQIDDIFSVQPLGEVENTLNRLRNRFVT